MYKLLTKMVLKNVLYYQKYKMFGLIKVPTMAYRPNTSMSIGSCGSVLFYENVKCLILVKYLIQ